MTRDELLDHALGLMGDAPVEQLELASKATEAALDALDAAPSAGAVEEAALAAVRVGLSVLPSSVPPALRDLIGQATEAAIGLLISGLTPTALEVTAEDGVELTIVVKD